MTITPEQARDLLDGATPGPWVKRRGQDGDPLPVVVSTPRGELHHIMTAEPAAAPERQHADTALIAAAPDLAQTIAGMTEQWGVERDRPGTAYIDGQVARTITWVGDEARARKACVISPRGGVRHYRLLTVVVVTTDPSSRIFHHTCTLPCGY